MWTMFRIELKVLPRVINWALDSSDNACGSRMRLKSKSRGSELMIERINSVSVFSVRGPYGSTSEAELHQELAWI